MSLCIPYPHCDRGIDTYIAEKFKGTEWSSDLKKLAFGPNCFPFFVITLTFNISFSCE